MKIITTITLFICLSLSAFGQKTYIPDDGFEQALIFEGLDTVMDDSITTSIIDTLTFLDLEAFGIVDLTGIEDFTALEIFVCRNNDILQVDLSNNPNIEFLNCENNFISNLDVTNCPNLTQLFAENNYLTSIDLTQNPLLENLIINQNGLGTIDLSSNFALKALALSNTSQTNVDLTNNWLLEVLDLSTNQLTSLNLTYAPNLITLALNGNSLTQLDLSNNPNLQNLFASNNNLTDLDFQNNPLLTYMSCAYNDLQSITLMPIDINSTANLGALYNPNLYCIQCDNPSYVNANWNLMIDTFTVISDLCASNIDELEASIEIFPNPTSDGRISVNTEIPGKYQLFSLNGAKLQGGEITKGANKLDFSSRSNGMYILRLSLSNQIITRQIEIL